MAKDAITMFKEAAAQLQKEIEYVALDSARKMNDEDEALQELIGDFNLARIDLNSELSKTSGRDDEKVAALNDKVNRLYNDIMMNDSMQAYNDAKTDFDAVIQYVNAIINTAVNGGDPMTVEQPAAGCGGSSEPSSSAAASGSESSSAASQAEHGLYISTYVRHAVKGKNHPADRHENQAVGVGNPPWKRFQTPEQKQLFRC